MPTIRHAGAEYYSEGCLLIPIEACSCDASRDSHCRVPSHRVAAKQSLAGSSRRRFWWLERWLRASQAGPVLITGCKPVEGGRCVGTG